VARSGNPIEDWIGGAAAHIQGMVGEVSPGAVAQRKEFKKSRDRLRMGNYGFSSAQQQQAQAMGNQQLQAQAGAQQSDIARMAAAGGLAGGAATEAQRAVAQQQAVGAAQVAAGVQQASNAAAQQQHMNDQGIVDAQADRARAFWREQGNISLQTTQGAAAPNPIGDWSRTKKPPPVSQNPAPALTGGVGAVVAGGK
jgi:hypothetical protein